MLLRYFSVRTVIIGVLLVTYALMASVLYYLLSNIHLKESFKIEQELVQKDIQRLVLQLDRYRVELDSHLNQWSVWNEAYDYVNGKNNKFEEEYLSDVESLYPADFFLFINKKGKILSAGSTNHETQSIDPLSSIKKEEILQELRTNLKEPSTYSDNARSGFITIKGVPYVVSLGPVKAVDETLPSGGLLIIARKVNNDVLANAEKETGLPISISVTGDRNFAEALMRIEQSDNPVKDLALVPTEEGRTLAIGLIRSLHGDPAIILETYTPELIFLRAKTALYTVLQWILVFASVTVLFSFFVIKKSILSPLEVVSKELIKIRELKDASLRLSPQNGKEFNSIVFHMNEALVALDEQEQEIEKAKASAENANAAKSQFLAAVSHELRTPIHGAMGILRMLLKRETVSSKVSLLKLADQTIFNLMETINDLLDMSKAEQGKLTIELIKFELNVVLKEVINVIAPRIQESPNLEIVCQVDSLIPNTMIGDPKRLRQILLNLIGNAVKFTPKGKVLLSVKVESKQEDKVIIAFSCADSGVGIPQHQIAQIFKPYEQADSSRKTKTVGTGLGLSVVKELTESMGGKISVESIEGKGSTFTVTLTFIQPDYAFQAPTKTVLYALVGSEKFRNTIAETFSYSNVTLKFFNREDILKYGRKRGVLIDGETFNPEEIPLELENPIVIIPIDMTSKWDGIDNIRLIVMPFIPFEVLSSIESYEDVDELDKLHSTRPLRIIVADDSKTNQLILVDLLEEAGHQVSVVENGLDMIELIRSDGGFDLVLADIQMPVMDGITATKTIREGEASHAQHLPIIAVTAHAFNDEHEEMKKIGFDDVITKPIAPEALNAVLSKFS